MEEQKIKGLKELIETVNLLKSQGKKIVHCHGCFDLIHPGHIRHLKFAKEQGDILLVSITGDNFVQKGYMNPFATQSLRATGLASIEYVDLVFINENWVSTDLIKEIKPDIYIKGQEYAKDKKVHPGFIEEKELIESLGGKIVYSPGDVIFSSTQIMNKLLQREDIKKEKINNFLVRYDINKEKLIEIIERYKDMKVLVIGDFFVEDYFFCKKQSNTSINSPILNFEFLEQKRFIGGVGLVAQYIRELGGDVKILCLGNEKSLEVFNQLNRSLVDKLYLTKIEDYSLPVKTIFLSNEQKIMELDRKIKIKIDEKIELDFIKKTIELLDDAQAVIFCSYNQGFLNKKIINSITEEARKKGVLCTLMSEEGMGENFLSYGNLDFVVCSEKEARYSVNNFTDGIDFLSRDILSKVTYKNLIIDLEKEGLIGYNPVYDPQQISSTYASYLPFLFDKIIDSAGKKESLISTIILSLISKSGIYNALYLGGCVSAIEASKMGNESVSKEELKSFLREDFSKFS